MEELENKYINLLLKGCLNFKKSKSLFISYDPGNTQFIKKLEQKAKELGIKDIYIQPNDKFKTHEILKTTKLEEIDNHPHFNQKKWDEYANKNASFLMLSTQIPDLMNDIHPDVLAKAFNVERSNKKIYKEKQLKNEIPWTIAVLPSIEWANDLFPDEKKPYDKFFELICYMCMVDREDPLKAWKNYITENQQLCDKLNDLNIEKLHYKNALGTNLEIYLPDNYNFIGAGNIGELVNMPSYEVFTAPAYNKTNGIVYNSKPLVFNGGTIDKFYIKFKDGEVIDYQAEIGEDILKGIINTDKYSKYLGEVALVNYDSPISNTKMVFSDTLLDENASCHFALGAAYPHSVRNTEGLNEQDLRKLGINSSDAHVDFMIGTKDLNIMGYTRDNKKVQIFKDGNFII